VFWNNSRKTPDITLAEISARLRGFILDSQINNAHEISVILGCAATSEEVAEKEEEESEKRIEKVSYLVPILYAHAHTLAEGATTYQKSLLSELEGSPNIPEEIWIESRKLMEQVSVSALIGSISQLIDMGLLEVPKLRRRNRGI
jgi:hypothetical protein